MSIADLTHTEPVAQPEPEPAVEAKPEPVAETQVAPKSEPAPKPKAAPKPKVEPVAVAQPKPEPELEATSEPEAVAVEKTQPQPTSEPEPQPEPAPEPEPEPEPEPTPEPEPELVPVELPKRSFIKGIKSLFSRVKFDPANLDDLEDILIQADFGLDASERIVQAVKDRAKKAGITPEMVAQMDKESKGRKLPKRSKRK